MDKAVEKSIEHLRSDDPDIFDRGLEALRERIDESSTAIFTAAQSEERLQTKGALIELLGESGNPQFIPFLEKQLRSDHHETKFWAFVALKRIGTPEALQLITRREVTKLFPDIFPHPNWRD